MRETKNPDVEEVIEISPRSTEDAVSEVLRLGRRTCDADAVGAVFVDCCGGGWAPGSFRLGEPKEVVEVGECRSGSEDLLPFEILERAVVLRPDLVWAGFISYDAGRCIERIPSVALRDRDTPLVCFAGYDRISQVDPDSFVTHAAHTAPALEEIPEYWMESIDRSQYEGAVALALDHIRAGDFYQVNLARRISAPAPPDAVRAAAEAFRYLCSVVRPPRGSFLRWGDTFVVSASPELFLSVRGREVVTKPIKGTRPSDRRDGVDAGPADLASSAKDRAENLMIVDLLRNDLGKVAEFGTVDVPSLWEVESLATVHHLVSTVTCTLRQDKSIFDLLKAAFPGGSVTGAPKVAAMEFIDTVEGVRRGVYTGAIGYIDPGGRLARELGVEMPGPLTELSIAIRTLVLSGGWWDLWVGSGIVADSDPKAEYQETIDKSRGLAGVLMGVEPATVPQRPSTY